MTFKKLDGYLQEATGVQKDSLDDANPFKETAFDGQSPRLGWVKLPDFSLIQAKLEGLKPALSGKKKFAFLGIGGSGNGIKVVLEQFKDAPLYVLDSLDPAAAKDVLKKLAGTEDALVIPVSKSGTTKETQSLALLFKDLFGERWSGHFLWMADEPAFAKLDAAGWQGCPKVTIQVDGGQDIGGRFSCPQTLIFWLPLYLASGQDISRCRALYQQYAGFAEVLRRKAFKAATRAAGLEAAYFFPVAGGKVTPAFCAWATQLFQESLGAKSQSLAKVKTLAFPWQYREDFLKIRPGARSKDKLVSRMLAMYFFQLFTAYYAALRKINFVNQDYVEAYKSQMRKLENEAPQDLPSKSIPTIIEETRGRLKPDTRFIEVVLYCYAKNSFVNKLRDAFRAAFPDKQILIFAGSDWNHHSYQAVSADQETLFVLLLRDSYSRRIPGVDSKLVAANTAALRLIARATYLTIQDKAILAALRKN